MIQHQTILITGATDGIGRALAQHYHAAGARLILIGRRPHAELDPQLFTMERYCMADLALPSGASTVRDFLAQAGIEHINILIQCAGVGFYGAVDSETGDSIDTLLNTNLRAPVALTHALLPYLVAARGQLVLIGSVVATLPAPDYAVYGATKAALEGFARSLHIELRGRVHVQMIHPGATKTAMHAKIGVPLDRIGWQRFPSPEQVAVHIAHAIKRRTPVATIGAGNRVLRFVGRYLAPLADWAVARQRGVS